MGSSVVVVVSGNGGKGCDWWRKVKESLGLSEVARVRTRVGVRVGEKERVAEAMDESVCVCLCEFNCYLKDTEQYKKEGERDKGAFFSILSFFVVQRV